MTDDQRPEDAIAVLQRWEEYGGLWQVTAHLGTRICISLCRCDNGEVVDRLILAQPELDAWLDGRTTASPR